MAESKWVGVVDDDASIRCSLARVFRGNGIRVETFAGHTGGANLAVSPDGRTAVSAGAAVVLATLASFWIHDLPSLVLAAAISVGTYVFLVSLIGGAAWRVEFVADWRTVLQG